MGWGRSIAAYYFKKQPVTKITTKFTLPQVLEDISQYKRISHGIAERRAVIIIRNPLKYGGIIPTWFGCFLGIQSLATCLFICKIATFCVYVPGAIHKCLVNAKHNSLHKYTF